MCASRRDHWKLVVRVTEAGKQRSGPPEKCRQVGCLIGLHSAPSDCGFCMAAKTLSGVFGWPARRFRSDVGDQRGDVEVRVNGVGIPDPFMLILFPSSSTSLQYCWMTSCCVGAHCYFSSLRLHLRVVSITRRAGEPRFGFPEPQVACLCRRATETSCTRLYLDTTNWVARFANRLVCIVELRRPLQHVAGVVSCDLKTRIGGDHSELDCCHIVETKSGTQIQFFNATALLQVRQRPLHHQSLNALSEQYLEFSSHLEHGRANAWLFSKDFFVLSSFFIIMYFAQLEYSVLSFC